MEPVQDKSASKPVSESYRPFNEGVEITNEPDDVQEQSPELFKDYLAKHEEAMEENKPQTTAERNR